MAATPKRISDFDPVVSATLADEFAVVQSDVTKKVTTQQIADLLAPEEGSLQDAYLVDNKIVISPDSGGALPLDLEVTQPGTSMFMRCNDVVNSKDGCTINSATQQVTTEYALIKSTNTGSVVIDDGISFTGTARPVQTEYMSFDRISQDSAATSTAVVKFNASHDSTAYLEMDFNIANFYSLFITTRVPHGVEPGSTIKFFLDTLPVTNAIGDAKFFIDVTNWAPSSIPSALDPHTFSFSYNNEQDDFHRGPLIETLTTVTAGDLLILHIVPDIVDSTYASILGFLGAGIEFTMKNLDY